MDIVERLKQWQDFTSNLIDADDLKETLSGAIDEIERLRKEVEKLEEMFLEQMECTERG